MCQKTILFIPFIPMSLYSFGQIFWGPNIFASILLGLSIESSALICSMFCMQLGHCDGTTEKIIIVRKKVVETITTTSMNAA